MDRRAYGRIQGLCGPRGLHVTGGQGAISRFAQMPTHLPPFIQEYATEGLAGLTCQLRHVTWPNCMPGAHCQASTHQSCPPAVLDVSLHRFYFCPFAPFHSKYTSCPTGAPLANGSAEVISHPLGLEWACGTRGTTHLPPQGPGAYVLRDELV